LHVFKYRKISNTIRTLVQYAPETFTVESWENVSLAVQYAPVLCHLSPSMPSSTSTKGVSCIVAGAGKVTLIGSNCPASRVGRCVDCEGGRTAQIFSDCAITKYLSNATARRLLIGRTTVLQCCALLPACLRFLHTVKHFRIVSYRIVSLMAVSCHH